MRLLLFDVLLVILSLKLFIFLIHGNTIEDKCHGKCAKILIPGSDNSSIFCDQSCRIGQCKIGCDSFRVALNASCQNTCEQKRLHIASCATGCELGLKFYADALKDQLGRLPAPELIRDSKNYSSVDLQWNGNILSNVTYLLQMKVIETDSDWQTLNNFTFTKDSHIHISGLHPYTTYKFMVVGVITPFEKEESEESVKIVTLSHGAPASAPEITSLSAPSPSVVSLSWNPPLFTNGPLLGYRIRLNPIGHSTLEPVNREIPSNLTSWTFTKIQSSQFYKVTLSAWNAMGEGPQDVKNITTPNPVSAEETPYLILGADNFIFMQNLLDRVGHADKVHKFENGGTFVNATEIFRLTTGDVQGVGVHIARRLVMLSDTKGNVWTLKLSRENEGTNTSKVYPSLNHPSAITIDWLNDDAYIVNEYKIMKCGLDMLDCTVAVHSLAQPPVDVKVDPINGFLFYTQTGPGKGIYVVSLADVSKNSKPRMLIPGDFLSSFTIDLRNIQLFYPRSSENTMYSAFIDGSQATDIRPSVIRPNFKNITSMAFFNGNFFWTSGNKVMGEEYDTHNQKYRHNDLLFFQKHFCGFNIFHPSIQPLPVPYNPPSRLQVRFTVTRAEIRWQKPENLLYQGKGAYDRWKYEVEIESLSQTSSPFRRVKKGSKLKVAIPELKPDTMYKVRVRAYSKAGKGQWSQDFIGRTMRQELFPAKVIVASTREITEIDLNTHRENNLVELHVFESGITDLDWYDDIVLWTNEMQDIYFFNRSEHDYWRLDHIQGAVSVAFDWLAKKVYWSQVTLYNSMIQRSSLLYKDTDYVYQTTARDIAIDSVNGRLYWATINTIESTLLNGDKHIEYFTLPHFSGKQVISLTLNFDLKKVCWYVKGYENQELFTADLISGLGSVQVKKSVKNIARFNDIARFSNIQYYSHRLFWLNPNHSLIVGDLECNFTSVISREGFGVGSFVIQHTSLHNYPENFNKKTTRVIPSILPPSSIKVEGKASEFNVTWQKTDNVNHGTVFYELSVMYDGKHNVLVTTDNWHTFYGVTPFTPFSLSLRPYTYWGKALPTNAHFVSPMSVPSQPLVRRVYITQSTDPTTLKHSLSADFRWLSPKAINGILSHHVVSYWKDAERAEHQTVKASYRHFKLDYLQPNSTYKFQVQSCTKVGCGKPSDTVSASTDALNPVPKMMIATNTTIKISEVDDVINSTNILTHASSLTMTYLAREDKVFWIDQNGWLVEYERNRRELLNGTGIDMSIDWIGRNLYIVEKEMASSFNILVYNLDRKIHWRVHSNLSGVKSIIVNPYRSTISWIEMDNLGRGHLLVSDLTGENRKQMFTYSSNRRKRNTCDCPTDINPGHSIAMDHSSDSLNQLYLYDNGRKYIYSVDVDGCKCRQVFHPADPPDMLMVDHRRVYWYTKFNGKLHSVTKDDGLNSIVYNLPGVRDMLAYGPHLQPLPASECLDPGPYAGDIKLVKTTTNSISLQLEELSWPDSCALISQPDYKYTIYYNKDEHGRQEPCTNSFVKCISKESYDQNVVLDNLVPYSEYVVHVAVSNFYTEDLAEVMGPPHIYRTSIGAPSVIKNVTADALCPNTIVVTWITSEHSNGPPDGVFYNVTWSTLSDGIYQEGRVKWPEDNMFDDFFGDLKPQVEINHLKPQHKYKIKVLACQNNGTLCSTSATVECQTKKELNPLGLVSATNDSLILSWRSPNDDSIMRHVLLYSVANKKSDSPDETTIMVPTAENTSYNETVSDLLPNTEYRFYMHITMKKRGIYHIHRWPQSSDFIFKTLSDVPAKPPPPKTHRLKMGSYEVYWSEPNDNGSPITHFVLKYRYHLENKWKVAYNGTEKRWLVDGNVLHPKRKYYFKVAAFNDHGSSLYSDNSTSFIIVQVQPAQLTENIKVIIAVTIIAFIFIVIVILIAICFFMRHRRSKMKKTSKSQMAILPRGPDTELATLRQLPHTAVQQSNTLYGVNYVPTDDDIAALPHFRRDQLMLTKFLGSGAFGEVFEGVAKDILGSGTGETRVAVKTLRKSAVEHEKEEFLKEALLMSNFKHEHILRLLGVCLDNDPQFIILELMEGGDLLSFLRNNRPTSTSLSDLGLTELVKICVHVAKGCKYLEDMHFVHRDLAARNCLVSSKSPAEMIVNIGDFGLARDIYKNDYYRKEGEGLLPVRWMSPESLMDGVFTTQSDIWAFGVLMWEVITFGQQPYPARTNIEVLHFVRSGGRLDKSHCCPDELYQLMCKCWSYASEDRPSFSYILQQLEIFYQKSPTLASQFTPTIMHSDVGGSDRRSRTSRRKVMRTLSDGCDESKSISSKYSSNSVLKQGLMVDLRSKGEQNLENGRLSNHPDYLNPSGNYVPKYIEILPDSAEMLLPYKEISQRERRKAGSSSDSQQKLYADQTNYIQHHKTFANSLDSSDTNMCAISNASSHHYSRIPSDSSSIIFDDSSNYSDPASPSHQQNRSFMNPYGQVYSKVKTVCDSPTRSNFYDNPYYLSSSRNSNHPDFSSDNCSECRNYISDSPQSMNYTSFNGVMKEGELEPYSQCCNNNTSQYNKSSSPQHRNASNSKSHTQVYPVDPFAGYDIVQASLV